MKRQVSHDVLRRMVSPPPPAPEDVPPTSSRAMRMAVTKAADVTHAMPISVTSIREEVLSLADCLDRFDERAMLIGMSREETLIGLTGLDSGLRAALIEVQTVGGVLDSEPDDRRPTKTDAVMAKPLLQSVLSQLQTTALQTPLDGWSENVQPTDQISDTRAAGLVLADRDYRVIRLSIDLHAKGRVGELIFALPDKRVADPAVPVKKEELDWDTKFQAAVNGAQSPLDAELHRLSLPIYIVEALSVGQVLSLPGCLVTSVKLRADDGRAIATARLGQAGGYRAIRVERALSPEISELPGLGRLAGEPGGEVMLPDDEFDGEEVRYETTLPDNAVETDFGFASQDVEEDMGFEMSDAPSFETADVPDLAATDAYGSATGDDELAWDLGDAGDGAELAELDWSSEGLDLPTGD